MSTIGPLEAERIRTTVVSTPLGEPVPMSFGSLPRRQTCLVEIEAGGLVGIGESWINYPAWAARERLATLCDGVAPLVLGRDVSDPEGVQRDLARHLVPVGRQWGAIGPIWQALSGIDIALWDLKGKAQGLSVSELLPGGSRRAHVPVYASGIGPTHVAELCRVAAGSGFTAVKAKIGFTKARDEWILAEARSVFGWDSPMFADANQAWSFQQAVAMCETLSRYQIDWVEEPLEWDRLNELEELYTTGQVPIATGENLYSVQDFRRYAASPGIHTIQPDLTKAGGLSVGALVGAYAEERGTDVAPHCYGSALGIVASLHLAALFPSVQTVEFDVRKNPLRTELLDSHLSVIDGEVSVPSGPGLGVELDPDAVRHYQVHQEQRT